MSTQDQPRGGPVPPGLMLQYLVVLAGTNPLVWRRIQVPATYSFWDLHVAIQDAMGWLDCHLHRFRVLDPGSGTAMLLGIPDSDMSPLPPLAETRTIYAHGYNPRQATPWGDTPLRVDGEGCDLTGEVCRSDDRRLTGDVCRSIQSASETGRRSI